jgi:putative tricarboxylic transport membrane protein
VADAVRQLKNHRITRTRTPKEENLKIRRIIFATAGAALLGAAAAAVAQGWSPQKNVEIVVGSAPGGSNDKTGRTVEKILVEKRMLPTSLMVNNKPGGGGNIALTFLSQKVGDAHYLAVATPSLLTNHITGLSPLNYTDFTAIASLFNDYIVFAVNTESNIKTGRDLIERLKKDPKSLSVGFATTLGSHNHIGAGLLMKAIGGEAKNLKAVAFKGSAEAIAALLGGHIDLVTTAAGNVDGHVAAGKLRIVGIASAQRFPGALAVVPTWKEQGINIVFGGWRAIIGPRGMSAAQSAYWEGALRKVVETPEWKADLARNYWSDDFVTGEQFRKDMAQDYAAMKAVLIDIGLAK